jgi:preprotein translocase subunit SecB
MQLSPLQLKRLFLRSVSVKAAEQFVREDEAAGALTVNVLELSQNTEDSNKWRVVVQILLHESDDGAEPPYDVAVEVEGYFEYASSEPVDLEAGRVVVVNGAGLLYSAAREHIWMLTSRGRWGSFMLPTVDLRDLEISPADDEESEEAEQPRAG